LVKKHKKVFWKPEANLFGWHKNFIGKLPKRLDIISQWDIITYIGIQRKRNNGGKQMTTKEIAKAVGKDERTVRRWVNQASDKMPGLSDKMSEAERTKKPADYTLEETCLIIEAGMGPDAAGIFRANAASPQALPKSRAVTGAYLRELNTAFDKSIINRNDWRRMAGLPPAPDPAGKQLSFPEYIEEIQKGRDFYQRIAEAGGLVNSDRDDLDAMYRKERG
jgi:hypothetical protein